MGPALPDGSLGVVLLRGLVSDPRLQCPVRSPVRCLVMDLGFVRLVRLWTSRKRTPDLRKSRPHLRARRQPSRQQMQTQQQR